MIQSIQQYRYRESSQTAVFEKKECTFLQIISRKRKRLNDNKICESLKLMASKSKSTKKGRRGKNCYTHFIVMKMKSKINAKLTLSTG